MAEFFDPSKTEAPTERRREQAREEGQVASSTDLVSSLVLLAALATLLWTGRQLAGDLLEMVRDDLTRLGRFHELEPEQVAGIFWNMFNRGLGVLGFLMGVVFVTAAGTGAYQVGFAFMPHLLAFKWERLSPTSGWERLLSVQAAVRAAVALGKVTLVFAVAYWVLRSRGSEIAAIQQMTLVGTVALGWRMAMHLALAVAGTLTLLGAVDYLWQRFRLEQSLRMSRQEVKDELKSEEGDPLVKTRVRKLQREAATKRMMLDVPKATVVITNPTHLAVALRYERGEGSAPKVLAKGADFVAAKIVATARRHGVPVLERKPVAQALYKLVKVGQEIPAGLYHVVAEILAFVYRQQSA